MGDCASKNYVDLSPNVTLPVPCRKDINRWVKDSWHNISGYMIRKTFNNIGLLNSTTIPSSVAHFDHYFTNLGIYGTEDDSNVDDDHNDI